MYAHLKVKECLLNFVFLSLSLVPSGLSEGSTSDHSKMQT